MSKVLVFRGSPRKGGNSDVLLGSVIRGMERGGGQVEVIRLCDLNIQGCLNCGACDHTGECVLQDDMSELYPMIIATEKIVLASPIYFYGITAQAKAFVDRTQALWNRKRLLQEKGEYQQDPRRKGYLVSVAATKGPRVFDGAILTMKYGYDAMDVTYAGEFLVRGVDKLGDMLKQADTLQEAEQAGMSYLL